MLYTTYFAKLRNLPPNVIPISICAKPPAGYVGLQYKKLAPTYSILMEYKTSHDQTTYINRFEKEILNRTNTQTVLAELQAMLPDEIKNAAIPFYANPNHHVALVCYERPESFCHRHLVAWWLNHNAGLNCKE